MYASSYDKRGWREVIKLGSLGMQPGRWEHKCMYEREGMEKRKQVDIADFVDGRRGQDKPMRQTREAF